MEYRVEELAAATGLAVDTVRFYQGKGLISAPRREGRAAIYDESHLEALERVRDLKAQGFSLSQIHRLLSDEEAIGSRGLLAALLKERVGSRTLTRNDFAAESGLGAPLVRAAEQAGLLVPLRIGDEERFTEADLENGACRPCGSGSRLSAGPPDPTRTRPRHRHPKRGRECHRSI